MNPKNSKAVIYCRVSTKEQVEEGNSLVSQERLCREYAAKNNFEVTNIFIEQGESAKTADRTELKKLLSFCATKKNQISFLIVYKIDRLSRNTDDYSEIRMNLRRYGIEIKSTTENFGNSPAGRFMENLMANVAQFDNDVRTERSVGGMKEAIREGRYVWQAPVGYINDKINGKSNIIPDDNAPLVREVFELLASYKMSVEEIRVQICEKGLRQKDGKPIAKSNFYRIIKNPIYCGWIHKFGEKHQGSFIPLVSEEIFNTAQRAITKRKLARSYNIQSPDFILRRIVSHPSGEKLTGCWSQGRKSKYAYYRFVKLKKQWPTAGLENRFVDFLNNYTLDVKEFDNLLASLQFDFSDKSKTNKIELEVIEQRKTTLRQKQAQLLDKNLDGIISDSLLKHQIESIDEEIAHLQIAAGKIGTKKVSLGDLLDSLREFLINPGQAWLKMPYELKLKWLRFEFPLGLTFDGKKFRTNKTSSILQVKSLISSKYSLNVTHQGNDFKHPISANSSASSELEEKLQELKHTLTAYSPPLTGASLAA